MSYETPVQYLIGDTPSQCIVEMSKVLDQPDKMEDDWRRLWLELLNRPFREEVVSEMKEGPTHFLLKLWCQTKPPSQTTVAHLIEALNSIYRNDVARLLEKHFKVCISVNQYNSLDKLTSANYENFRSYLCIRRAITKQEHVVRTNCSFTIIHYYSTAFQTQT